MQFNSLTFLFVFLPFFLAVYYIFPGKLRNPVLLIGSLLFYALGSGGQYWWCLLLVFLTVLTYFSGLLLEKSSGKAVLSVHFIFLLGLLAFFKLFKAGKLLPAGLSFFIFQMAAYLYEVNTGMKAEKNFLSYGAQITMFPKLMSGPLVPPLNLCAQAQRHKFRAASFHRGLQELILGLGMKVIIANRLGGLWGQAAVYGYESISTPFAWMALIAFALRLYLDFWGYSLMAMGIGRMIGFHLPRNFADPYASKTVSEFYRRWHITLGAWFRDYIYIPLGGSRKGTVRTVINLAAVWLFTGFWHGIGGNYLIWAGFLLTMILLEKFVIGKLLDKSRILCHVYLVFVILLSWVPFSIGNPHQMVVFLGRLFGFAGSPMNPGDYLIWGKQFFWLLTAGIFLATPFPGNLWRKIRTKWYADLLLFVIFWASVFYISTSAQDPFLYFSF